MIDFTCLRPPQTRKHCFPVCAHKNVCKVCIQKHFASSANVFLFVQQGSKTMFLLPASFAHPRNISGNNVIRNKASSFDCGGVYMQTWHGDVSLIAFKAKTRSQENRGKEVDRSCSESGECLYDYPLA